MKKERGRAVAAAVLLLAALSLFGAGDYDWNLTVSKREVFVREPFLVTFSVRQTDPTKVMFFDFRPLEEGRWFVKRLDKKVDDAYHRRKAVFTYLVYALRSGEAPLRFDLLVKRTNDERIALSTTGGRDNVKDVETSDTHEAVPARRLDVKPLPEPVPLVGDYRLRVRLDRRQTTAMSPVYLTIRLQGVGAMPGRLALLPEIDGVRVFDDEPVVRRRYDAEGVHYDATFSYALIAESDFVVPPIGLRGFSYEKRRLYTLRSPEMKVRVVAPPVSGLVDKQSRPESIYETIEALGRWGLYLLIFASGYLTAQLARRLGGVVRRRSGLDPFYREVRNAGDAKTLLNLLLRREDPALAPMIEDLEKAVYQGKKIDLKKIKKAVLDHA